MEVAPRAGFEPATNRLTAGCSTTELPGNTPMLRHRAYNKACPPLQSVKARDLRAPQALVKTGGGHGRNRTGVHGFAVRCVTTPPRGQFWKKGVGCPRLYRRESVATIAGETLRFGGHCSTRNAFRCFYSRARMTDFAAARRHMVEGQVRTADVTDLRIQAAMLEIPRENFVPPALAPLAYLDIDLPVDEAGSRRLLKPMVLAKLIHAADVSPSDRVLDVGSAGGYGAAVLSRIAGEVVALEQDAGLGQAAR